MSRAVTDAPADGAAPGADSAAPQRDGARAMGSVFSRSTLMTVRRVLHAYREGWLLEGRLAVAARMIVEDARQQDLAAAQMLVALKPAWAALDEVRRASPLDARELLSRLVTLSIYAYYEPARASRRARGQTIPTGQTHPDRDARTAA